MSITYKAPASLLLSGDYSLLYNEPAIFLTIKIYNSFTILEPKKTPKKPEIFVEKVEKSVEKFLKEKNIDFVKKLFEYRLDQAIPKTEGFGSTASLVVVICAGIYEYYTGSVASSKILRRLSRFVLKDLSEKKISGQLASSILGGLVYYRNEFEFLDFQTKLPFEISQEFKDNFYLIYTGQKTEKEETLKLKIDNLLQENPARVKKVFRDIGKTSKTMVQAMKEEREKLLIDTISKNAKLLTHLDVVSSSTSNLLLSLEGFGAGKTTGFAGYENGSGYILFYCYPKAKKDLEEFLEKRRLPFIKVEVDSEGIQRVAR